MKPLSPGVLRTPLRRAGSSGFPGPVRGRPRSYEWSNHASGSRQPKVLLLSALCICTLILGSSAPEPAWSAAGSDRIRTAPPGSRSASARSFPAGLDSLSAATLDEALDYLDFRPIELGFDKLYAADDTFRLGIVEELLGDPLRMPGWQEETLDRLRDSRTVPSRLARALGEICEAPAMPERSLDPNAPAWPAASAGTGIAPGEIPQTSLESIRRGMEAAVQAFVSDCRDAEGLLQQAYSGLDEEEKNRLLMLAPAFWGDASDAEDQLRKGMLHRALGAEVDTAGEYTEDPVLDAGAALDRTALTAASRTFLDGVMRCAERLGPALQQWASRETPAVAAGPLSVTTLDGVTGDLIGVFETPWGLLILGGTGPNQYSPDVLERTAFIFEPGGDDVYRGRAASALGGLLRPMSAVIDWAGDDLYDAHRDPYALGGAVLGLAVLADLSGDDTYLGEDGSCGAGFFGVGFLYDGQGVDRFEGRNLSQGAGAFGLGALVSEGTDTPPPGPELTEDRGFQAGMVKVPGTGSVPIRYDENDLYRAARYSQGFASTFGAGLLYDRMGNDTYRTGGRYLHAPLLPNDFQSLSQGFSIGFRPRAGGGVGILMDEEGNDFYNGEVYCQGSSYWYSIGILFDGAGNDRYLATQYSQGAGIHLSIGSLWDQGGDDHYVCKYGVSQGTAHDLGLAWFLEEGGNDFYVVSDGQGVSLTNSVAIFIDTQGDDLYATPGRGQGWTRWARGFAGAGIFLDLEGKDTYPAGSPGANGTIWSSELYALGIDLDRDVQLPAEVVPEPVLTAEDSSRTVEELFETASMWEVGSAREPVRRARAALIARGMEAVRYAVAEELGSESGLVYRTLEELGKALPDSFAALILPRLYDPELLVRRNAVNLLGDLKRTEAMEPMAAMLRERDQEKLWTSIIHSLGVLGEPEAAPHLRPFLSDQEERRRIYTVTALMALRDTTAVPQILELLNDPMLTVRSAASSALISFGRLPVRTLAARLEDPRTTRGLSSRASPASDASGSLDAGGNRMIWVRTLGRIAVSLADSTGRADLEARGAARRALLMELERYPSRPLEPSTGARPEEASARAAAAEALLDLGDEETMRLVRLHMADESDPLVRRTYERWMEERGSP